MSTDSVKAQLAELRLHGMIQAYEVQISSRAFDEFTRDEIIEHLAVGEMQLRNDRAHSRLRKVANLKHKMAEPEDIIYDPARGIEKRNLGELLSPDWIRRTENLLITGATGVGKSWVGCAIANSVMRYKMTVRYFRTNELLREMRLSQQTATFTKLKKQLVKPAMLILDDFGLAEIDETSAELLLDLLDARIDLASTMVIGQRAVEQWHDYIGSVHMADAIIDRLLQRAHRINLKGPSLRGRLK